MLYVEKKRTAVSSFFFFKVAFIGFLQINSLYIYSLQDKITEFYMPWNLNGLSLPGWSTIVFLCFVIYIFGIFEPFPAMTV